MSTFIYHYDILANKGIIWCINQNLNRTLQLYNVNLYRMNICVEFLNYHQWQNSSSDLREFRDCWNILVVSPSESSDKRFLWQHNDIEWLVKTCTQFNFLACFSKWHRCLLEIVFLPGMLIHHQMMHWSWSHLFWMICYPKIGHPL